MSACCLLHQITCDIVHGTYLRFKPPKTTPRHFPCHFHTPSIASMSPECVSEIILPLKNGSLSCLCTLPGFIWSRMYMYSHTSHQMASRYYVFKVATCCFLFLLVSCGCQGPLIPLFNEQRLACFCCCLSAVAALTRGDTQVWVPGLIAAALADSLSVLHSHWLPRLRRDSLRHPKTNKPGRTINSGWKS